MNIDLALERLPSVLKPDSITASQGDFLATHIPLKKLLVLDKFEFVPKQEEGICTEDELYRKYVLNEENKHQFIAVYGQSGTGKSHLIRWFEARFTQDKPENEVILFIRRSDNTLKGTIRQLLEKPEIKTIEKHSVYSRLVKASAAISEEKLKDMIYHNFIVEVNNDSGNLDLSLKSIERKRLIAFLSNDLIQEKMMESDGPIERIYSKIAEEDIPVDRDVVAQFTAEDFDVDQDLYETLETSGADQKALKMLRSLNADDSDEPKKIADYLNQFVSEVIQNCAGIESGDFQQIFIEIRKEFFKQGKNLTLFIEDITSFTGVDSALLNALMEEHTGLYAEEGICRISSFVGSTNNYLEHNFKDNHKDRITKYIYISDNAFNETDLHCFVAKYLNTMSLPQEIITKWMQEKADPTEYPVHEVTAGKNWEFVEVEAGKRLCLYPFTKFSINYLYEHRLKKGHKTPRYIIREIIEPVVSEVLYNKEAFPSDKYQVVSSGQEMFRVISRIKEVALKERLLRFMCIWGNGKPEKYTVNDTVYLAGIRKEAYEDFGLPIIDLEEAEIQQKPKNKSIDAQQETAKNSSVSESERDKITEKPKVSKQQEDKVNKTMSALHQWINGETIDTSSTLGTANILKAAKKDMGNFVNSAINWQAEGFSDYNISKIKSSLTFIDFENQEKRKHKGFYTLPANIDSFNIIMAFVKWREYGKESWNYADSEYDAFLITEWISEIKDDLISSVKRYIGEKSDPYIKSAVISEIYTKILRGDFTGKTLKKFDVEALFADSETSFEKTGHCREWTALLNVIGQKDADQNNQEIIRQYFNIRQGSGGGSVIVLDSIPLEKMLSEVKRKKLSISENEYNMADPVKLRKDTFLHMENILKRVDTVAEKELASAKLIMDQIFEDMDEEDFNTDGITDLIEIATEFYKAVDDTQINIASPSLEKVKKQRSQIAKALKEINDVLDEEDTLKILLAFSDDPLSELEPLTELLNQLHKDMEKAEKQIQSRLEKVGGTVDDAMGNNRYQEEIKWIGEATELLESLR